MTRHDAQPKGCGVHVCTRVFKYTHTRNAQLCVTRVGLFTRVHTCTRGLLTRRTLAGGAP